MADFLDAVDTDAGPREPTPVTLVADGAEVNPATAAQLTSLLAVFSNSFANITTATTTTVKSGAGTLHTVTINSLGTVASAVVIYDNTAGSGTKIATINSLSVLGTLTFDVAFATGLTLVTTGTVAPDVTVSYR